MMPGYLRKVNHTHCIDTTSMCAMWCSKGLSDECLLFNFVSIRLEMIFVPGINHAIWNITRSSAQFATIRGVVSDLVAIPSGHNARILNSQISRYLRKTPCCTFSYSFSVRS